MEEKVMPPVHPGELLREEFLGPMGITPYRLAKDIGVPVQRVHELVHERRGVTADTALRLSRYFGMSEGYWMNAQKHYELEVEKDRLGAALDSIRPRSQATA
ncbi:MAG: HigA family addiction module antidote protein [Rubrobacter sp.]|nr:HigA family addiction module antidote protein [Rubrobacter sp.]